MHCDLALQPQRLQPGLIVDPQVAAATADEGVVLEVCECARDAVAGRIIPAAVKRPVVDAELPADETCGLVRGSTPKRDIRLASAEVADLLAGVELKHDL